MKKEIEIKVMGQKFKIRSDSNEDYVNKVAVFVDEKMTEVLKSSKSVASLSVAILAAMNIADEFLKYKEGNEKTVEEAKEKIKGIIELIDLQA